MFILVILGLLIFGSDNCPNQDTGSNTNPTKQEQSIVSAWED